MYVLVEKHNIENNEYGAYILKMPGLIYTPFANQLYFIADYTSAILAMRNHRFDDALKFGRRYPTGDEFKDRARNSVQIFSLETIYSVFSKYKTKKIERDTIKEADMATIFKNERIQCFYDDGTEIIFYDTIEGDDQVIPSNPELLYVLKCLFNVIYGFNYQVEIMRYYDEIALAQEADRKIRTESQKKKFEDKSNGLNQQDKEARQVYQIVQQAIEAENKVTEN